jgi:hypothetical protein
MSNEHCHAWIKMSDRKPTEADLPIMLGMWVTPRTDPAWFSQDYIELALPNLDNWQFWYPCPKSPPLPAKEPTRDEQDEKAFKDYLAKDYGVGAGGSWRAALEYEREQLRAVIALYTANDITIQELVKRVKERVL